MLERSIVNWSDLNYQCDEIKGHREHGVILPGGIKGKCDKMPRDCSVRGDFALVSGGHVENEQTREPKGISGVHYLNEVCSLWLRAPINMHVTEETGGQTEPVE